MFTGRVLFERKTAKNCHYTPTPIRLKIDFRKNDIIGVAKCLLSNFNVDELEYTTR